MGQSTSAIGETDNIFLVRYHKSPYPRLTQTFTSVERIDRPTKKRKRGHECAKCGDTYSRFDILRRHHRMCAILSAPCAVDNPVLHANLQAQPTISAPTFLHRPSEYIDLPEQIEFAAVGGMDGNAPEPLPTRPIGTTASSGMCPSDAAFGQAHQDNTNTQIVQPTPAKRSKKHFPLIYWRSESKRKEPAQGDVEVQGHVQTPIVQTTPAIDQEQTAPNCGGSTSRHPPPYTMGVIVPSCVEEEKKGADERRRWHCQNM
jgi:hypothetical protein